MWIRKDKNFFEKYEKNFIDLINTGNPVGKIKEKENSLNNSSCLKVLVLGGSQGSMFLNELIPETFKEFIENNSLEVKHQSGYKNETKVKDNYSTFIGEVTVQAFIEDIESAYQWADIIICRSGALTVSEIIASRSVGVCSYKSFYRRSSKRKCKLFIVFRCCMAYRRIRKF